MSEEKEMEEDAKGVENDYSSHVLFSREEVWIEGKDSPVIEKLIEQFGGENTGGVCTNRLLARFGTDRVKNMVVGPRHIAFLLDDNNVVRIEYDCAQVKEAQKETEVTHNFANSSGILPPSVLHQSSRSNNTKFRRVMLSNRSYCRIRATVAAAGDGRGVITVDRSARHVVPASNVPEELVNQAMAVLQGKSRDVIVRELQRTGLNVNEAVNNLLSRDDDDDGMDLAQDAMLPEELLQLLEHNASVLPPPSSTAPGPSGDASANQQSGNDPYADALAFATCRDYRPPGANYSKKSKDKKKKEDSSVKNSIVLGDTIEWWCGEEGSGIPEEVASDSVSVKKPKGENNEEIVKLVATSWALFVLHKNGKVYTWQWDEEVGGEKPIMIYHDGIPADGDVMGTSKNPIVSLVSSNLRIAVMSAQGHVVSWLDKRGVGKRASAATRVMDMLTICQSSNLLDFVCSDNIFSVRYNNTVFWGGFVPVADRGNTSEKQRKHVSFEPRASNSSNSVSECPIVVGSLVHLKSQPMYPAGSVGVYIDTNRPQIGILMEDVWSTGESSRFRVVSPDEYDREILKTPDVVVKQEVVEDEGTSSTPISALTTRKRKATSPEITTSDDRKERKHVEVWSVDDVVWIYQHCKRGVMSVKVVDNQYVAVQHEEQLGDTTYASKFSDNFNDEVDMKPNIHKATDKMRILRKDELQLVRYPSSNSAPLVMHKKLLKFVLDTTKPIMSMVADLNGFRILLRSKHDPHLYLCRVAVTGKVLSRRRLPVHLPAVERPFPGSTAMELLSFGDSRTLFLRDSTGQLIPLVRDAINGFREPPAMNAMPIAHIATMARPVSHGTGANYKGAKWEGMVVTIPGSIRPVHKKLIDRGATLLQLVLYCDYDGVASFLDKMVYYMSSHTVTPQEYRQIMTEQLFEICSDGCSSLLHAAIRLTIANKNSANVDKQKPEKGIPTPYPEKAANVPWCVQRPSSGEDVDEVIIVDNEVPSVDVVSQSVDVEGNNDESPGRWKGVLRERSRRSDTSPTTSPKSADRFQSTESTSRRAKPQLDRSGSEESSTSSSTLSSTFSKSTTQSGPYLPMPKGKPSMEADKRQKAALDIVQLLLNHPALMFDRNASANCAFADETDHLSTLKALLSWRDLSGNTPFQLAINLRAYGAAHTVWRALLQLQIHKMKTPEEYSKYIFPSVFEDSSYNADDNPLFVLCYNDVCSFTWTGEDHINQDIYECRTCGLTGSLCCCSECALSCHRNHDCKLKRTSPTAYCDCWEKCACKALIQGNDFAREDLFLQLLEHTRLYDMVNARNEHLMLFLCRTVIRQMREQNGQPIRKRGIARITYATADRSSNPNSGDNATPEHDLQPPKFSRFALHECCSNFDVIKSAITYGWKPVDFDERGNRDSLHLLVQSHSAHLDKFSFVLMNKRLKEYSHDIVITLRKALLSSASNRDPDLEEFVSRLVRSIIRVVALAVNISPAAAGVIVCGGEVPEASSIQGSGNREETHRIRLMNTLAFSGILPVIKRDANKHDKTSGLVGLVQRAISLLRLLPTIAILELTATADTLMAPVRFGIVRPMINPAMVGNHDPLDLLEKHFNSEQTWNETLKKSRREEKGSLEAKSESTRRSSTRRDTDREEERSGDEETMDQDDGVSESHDGARANADATSGPRRNRRRRNSSMGAAVVEEERVGDEERREFDDDVDDEAEESDRDDDDDDDDDMDEDDDGDDSEDNVAPMVYMHEDEMDESEDRMEQEAWNYEPSSPSEGGDDEERRRTFATEGQGGQEDVVVDNVAVNDNAEQQPANNAPQNDDEAPTDGRPTNEDSDDDFLNRQHNIATRIGQGAPPPVFGNESGSNTWGLRSARQVALYSSRGSSWNPAFVPRYISQLRSRRGNKNRRTTGGGQDDTEDANVNQNDSSSSGNTERDSNRPPSNNTLSQQNNNASSSGAVRPGSGGSHGGGDGDGNKESVSQAKMQMALAYSLLTRLACDIYNKMEYPLDTREYRLDPREARPKSRSNVCRKQIFEKMQENLAETFEWMMMQMDHLEAKLRFNHSYLARSDVNLPTSAGAPEEKGGARKESFNYLMSVMRGMRDEAKDHLAVVEKDMLYSMALLLEGYIAFLQTTINTSYEWKSLIDQFDDSFRRRSRSSQCENIDTDVIVQFFARPDSLLFPGYLIEGAWDTVSGRDGMEVLRVENDIPLIERPDLLTMDASPVSMFRPPDFDNALRPMKSVICNRVENVMRKYCKMSNFASLSLARPLSECRHLSTLSFLRNYYYAQPDATTESTGNVWESAARIDWRMTSYYPDTSVPDRAQMENKPMTVDTLRDGLLVVSATRTRFYLEKWMRVVELIGKECYNVVCESLGNDIAYKHSMFMRYMARFGVRHEFFMKAAEKFRAIYTQNNKEVTLDVHRDQAKLLRDTMIALNQLFARRITNSVRTTDPNTCSLAGTRLRVRFVDEPGEGTGVTRSFFTAFAEACALLKTSPLQTTTPESTMTTSEKDQLISSLFVQGSDTARNPQYDPAHRTRRLRREKAHRLRTAGQKSRKYQRMTSAPRYDPKSPDQEVADDLWERYSWRGAMDECPVETVNPRSMEPVAQSLYHRVSKLIKSTRFAGRIVGILCQMPPCDIITALKNDDTLRLEVQYVAAILCADGEWDELESTTVTAGPTTITDASALAWEEISGGTTVLFEKTPHGTYYTPVAGTVTALRISAFRNVGRVMGVCLSQGDIFPLRLARHVLSFILRHPINWLDLGFYDPQIFNSLRGLLNEDHSDPATFDYLTFSVDSERVVNGTTTIEVVNLKANGGDVPVTRDNVVEYVYRYADRILLGANLPALEAIREGVLDMIPESLLEGLTPEDLRLIICGTEEICIETLESNTVFLDESRANLDTLTRFKQWFWQVVESLTPQEKRDLVFFWTGTPTLPPSGEWQTRATIMLRPQEDTFLPTANTCISRLYVPVYSSKRVLKTKLQMAIKSKTFGFV